MPQIHEGLISKARKSTAVIAIGLAAPLVSGCVSTHNANEGDHSTSSTISPKPSTSETAPFSSVAYQTNEKRDSLIRNAVQSFGTTVLEQSTMPNSPWAPFRTNCSPGEYPGNQINTGEGGVLQGYQPTDGQNCYVEHSPIYGGESTVVGADVVIDPNGMESDQINGVRLYDLNCSVDIANEGPTLGWEVRIGEADASPETDTYEATSLSQAQTIDNQALNCLAVTHP